jgi:hypothetical protein
VQLIRFGTVFKHGLNFYEADEMGGACSTNGGEEARVYVNGGKARLKETTRKTKP